MFVTWRPHERARAELYPWRTNLPTREVKLPKTAPWVFFYNRTSGNNEAGLREYQEARASCFRSPMELSIFLCTHTCCWQP